MSLRMHRTFQEKKTGDKDEEPAMAKGKATQGVQNRAIYSRASYLYQAAAYLSNHQQNTQHVVSSNANTQGDKRSAAAPTAQQQKAMRNMSRQMISNMRAVTLKSQIRQSPDMKRSICKYCDTLLVEGESCTSTIENASKGGKKPWADVLSMKCSTCGNVKRYPTSAPRQKRLSLRKREQKETREEEQLQQDLRQPKPAEVENGGS